MEQIEKINEPNGYEKRYCPRCDEVCCYECIPFETVNFDIIETTNENHPNPNAPRDETNWKNDDVCPWCYNQLVEKHNKENV